MLRFSRSPAVLMACFFAAAFFANGIVLPYFPVILADRGLTGEEIAFVLAMPYLGRLVSMPIITGLADRVSDRRWVVAGVAASMLATGLAFGPLSETWAIMAVGSVLLVLNFSIGPLADAIAVSMQRRGQGDYGRMRLWGSATFIIGNLAGGYVLGHFGVPSLYILVLLGVAMSLCATVLIPPAGPLPPAAHVSQLLVLRKPAFLGVLAASALIQASHAALYGFATLTWQSRGFDEVVIGALWAIGVIAEIILFAYAWRLPARIAPITLIMAGAVIGVLRWALFAVDTGLAATAILQVLHAGSFALGHLGIMRFISRTVPEQRAASAQGTYVIMVGIGMAAATAIAGRLWIEVGDDAFLAMSAFCLAGLTVLTIGRSGARRLLGANSVPA